MPVENVSRLSITLKLPLKFFQSVERLSNNDSTSSDTDLATQQASQWQRLGPSLSWFKALKKLDLWLDHTEPQFWAVVNERSTLSSLLTQLSNHPNLDVTVTLPMVHPKFEQDERHYIDEEISPKIISPNVRIHRVLRQKRYAVDDANGDVKIVKKYDFPFMYDEYLGLGLGMSLAEMAKRERGEWKQGRNMENEAARASLDSFAQGYKRLQDDNDHLRNELAERTRTHEQTITQLRQAAEHQNTEHAAALKATNKEIRILRQEKESLKESIKDMESQITSVNDEVTKLRAENARLRSWSVYRTREVKGYLDKIKDCNKSFESYRERVRDLANED
ncbi:hypothetical protein J4E93_005243 [Alternaria ventricosa]|uniref:uncharacterized protein n=1 Tax=Alternaria ventricosa TaxID=1187951 RepID=UPI0020C39D91|nr:uncharacterized protein J4E93_005243 [Alternaria ventricosa]KAI4645666.1 hypothetical protein J4E93_005243 [Alternaria ventricosa]